MTTVQESEDGARNLAVSEVDEGLTKAIAHSNELEQRARQLQAHFQQAQKGMGEISRLCDQADTSVVRSQALLNRSAHRIHELSERLQHLVQAHQPAEGGASFPSTSGALGRADGRTGPRSKSKPSAGPRRPSSSRGSAR
ncbi:unnamed protein product [Effrenium voratum]|uniref:Uncharacterized protein n=1 Tax=Effrenium voratum TaxID=2562239 RepID=A0AA36MNX2_9DINO|nr:unnamed protein product [Effrenium voratum]